MNISILLATYNGAEYVIEQLKSFMHQTRQPDEVVIIDDCSTDNTVSIVNEYIEKMNLGMKWKLVINSNNKGWRRNFHDGISLTSGNIVFFSDQDDIWHPNKIDIISKLFEENENINVIGSDKTFFYDVVPDIREIDEVHVRQVSLGHRAKNMLIQTGGSTMAFRRDYYEKIGEFYSPEVAHDDFFWKMSVIDDSLLVIDEPLILRRLHGDNASMEKRNRLMAISMLEKQILTATSVFKYIDGWNEDIPKRELKKKIVNDYINGNAERLEMIKSSKIRRIRDVLPYYKDIYFGFRTLIGDVILTLYPKWRS